MKEAPTVSINNLINCEFKVLSSEKEKDVYTYFDSLPHMFYVTTNHMELNKFIWLKSRRERFERKSVPLKIS